MGGHGITPPQHRGHATRPLAGAALPLLAASAVLLLGCGSDGGTDQTSSASDERQRAATQAVTIKDYTYKPATITVPVGTTVKFTNEDSTAHTATSKESGVFESGAIETGKSGHGHPRQEPAPSPTTALFHPFMKGTITVE